MVLWFKLDQTVWIGFIFD